MSIILSIPKRSWECPNCDLKVTTVDNETNRFHNCPGLHGLTAPLVPEGQRCKVEAKEREDYAGKDLPQLGEDNRAYMSVVVTRDDGQDCAVLAPSTQVRGEID